MRYTRLGAAIALSLTLASTASAQNLRYFGFVGNGDSAAGREETKRFANFAYTASDRATDFVTFKHRLMAMRADGLKAIVNLSFLWCEVPAGSGHYQLCDPTHRDWESWWDTMRRRINNEPNVLSPDYILAITILDEPYPKLTDMTEYVEISTIIRNNVDPGRTWLKLMMIEGASSVACAGSPGCPFNKTGATSEHVDWIGIDEYAIRPLDPASAATYNTALSLMRGRFGWDRGTVYVMDAFWDPAGNDFNHPGRLGGNGNIGIMADIAWEWYHKASSDSNAVALGGFIWSEYADRVTVGHCGQLPPAQGGGPICFPCEVKAAHAAIGRLITGYGRSYSPIGYMDGIDNTGKVTGWACDRDAVFACETVRVNFYVDGFGWVSPTTANLSSEPAVNAQCGVGTAHRFSATLPASTAGRRITAYADDLTYGSSQLPSLCPEAPGCSWRPEPIDKCTASPPAGAWNSSAQNTGYYDYLCGYYKYYYGYDPYGYCSQAVSFSQSARIHTAGTGDCANGAVYNYYAGLYNYYCRYYEYNGYGWNYGGYCTTADSYAAQGRCERCGTATTPTCRGTASLIWIQPQWRAGFGPLNSLIVAGSGSTTGTCAQRGVDLYWRTPGMAYWVKVPYSALVGSDGIWLNAIENANPTGTYYVYVTYHDGPAAYCTYDGRNDIVWCQ